MGEHVVLLPQHVQGEQMHSCASFREETLERRTFTAKIQEIIRGVRAPRARFTSRTQKMKNMQNVNTDSSQKDCFLI